MKRRDLLKNLGLGAGYVVVAPSVFSLLQSCTSDPDWQPIFLTASNGYALKHVLDIIIPKDETPGAGELNIAQFIDSYMDKVAKEHEQRSFKAQANAFAINFKSEFDKDIVDGKPEEFEKMVAKYLGAEKEKRAEYDQRLSATQDPEKPEKEEIDTEANSYGYLNNVRDKAVWAWKTSEAVGENVLWYDPVPGAYKGCISLEEAGGGKIMSL
ncbi:gluconate 2-dehydrogenase subunit 3 family protein [Flavimarina sp. Hel_I_48]|uniref:gluconate 2-dehydrogenase subunit 3 family protein n=1 Tax=Flavimarina sp. Hel_I_48 TaxID=1392488 RepID=UPI0004DEEB48|nr:gluconate 2-dehydrogenase subunit 3 family protein [Flavimarina sp. Hel_I_48]